MVSARLPIEEPHVDVGVFLHEGRHQPRREIFRRRDDAELAGCPARTPLIASIWSSSRRSRSSIACAVSTTARPAAVGRMPSCVRSNSASPTSSSNCWSWIVTAGGVRPNTLAALMILPCAVIAWMALQLLQRKIAHAAY